MHHGLRTDSRKVGLGAVASSNFDEREVGVTSGDGLEGEGAETAMTADACGVGRTLAGDGDEAVFVVTMSYRDGLAIASQEVSCVDVDELQDSWVELHLQRHGVDIAGVAEHDGDLEGAAHRLVGACRNH